jgi:hypothetical protein
MKIRRRPNPPTPAPTPIPWPERKRAPRGSDDLEAVGPAPASDRPRTAPQDIGRAAADTLTTRPPHTPTRLPNSPVGSGPRAMGRIVGAAIVAGAAIVLKRRSKGWRRR